MLRWFFIVFGVLGLISIRAVENQLFYDPFLAYFKSADQTMIFPDFVWGKLIVGYLLRFVLNTFFSLIIVHFLFQNKEFTKQAFVLMLLIFVLVFPIYLYCIEEKFQFGYLFSFYIRRFVIQPLALLIIVPTFYYRKKIVEAA